jgi:transposase
MRRPSLLDSEVAAVAGVGERTVSRLRQRCVEEGLDAALERKARRREKSRSLDGDGEARLVALMCSAPPPGQSRWTLNLLGNRLVELGIVESISYETVRRVLKKHL